MNFKIYNDNSNEFLITKNNNQVKRKPLSNFTNNEITEKTHALSNVLNNKNLNKIEIKHKNQFKNSSNFPCKEKINNLDFNKENIDLKQNNYKSENKTNKNLLVEEKENKKIKPNNYPLNEISNKTESIVKKEIENLNENKTTLVDTALKTDDLSLLVIENNNTTITNDIKINVDNNNSVESNLVDNSIDPRIIKFNEKFSKINESSDLPKLILCDLVEKHPVDPDQDIFTQKVIEENGQEITVKRFGAEIKLMITEKDNKTKRKYKKKNSDRINWQPIINEILKDIDPKKTKNVVYNFTNVYTLKGYLGKSVDLRNRTLTHIRSLGKKRKSCPNFHKALSIYGALAMKPEIKYQGKNLGKVEHKYIKQYNYTDPSFGYNIKN